MIYLDTAALVKLVRRETESDRLADWIDLHSETPLVSSVLSEVEIAQALRRSSPDLLSAVPAMMAHISLYEIDDLVRTTAAAYPQASLRSLDAIHLATAQAVFAPRLTTFVTYDPKLKAAAEEFGLPTASPGQD